MRAWIEGAKRRIRRHVGARRLFGLKARLRGLRPVGPLPDFIIIGTQKGGTTALFEMLAQHPGVSPSLVKEVHYFDINYHRGEHWYRRHFPLTESGVSGEASPYYLFHPAVPDRLRALVPKARLIVILRDPVERALSHYFHSRRRGYETLPMLEAFEAEEARLAGQEAKLGAPDGVSYAHQHHSYVARSRYMEQLERWKGFDLLVISNSQLRSEADETFARVCRFIGVEPIPAPALIRPLGGEKAEVDPEARRYLQQQLAGETEAVEAAWGLRL